MKSEWIFDTASGVTTFMRTRAWVHIVRNNTWCLGLLCRQGISSLGIDYEGYKSTEDIYYNVHTPV